MLRFISLGSGSSGNATVVESSDGLHTSRLLVDCGFNLKQLDHRLARAGLCAADIDAIFVTHEHSDHIGSALALARRQQIPLWMSPGSHAAIGNPELPGLLRLAGDTIRFEVGTLQVCPFTVPHDAREPLQLRCSDGDRQLGILTDLGHASDHVLENLRDCHAVLLECNHDPALLAASNYHPALKRRVGGPYGHLSNEAAGGIALALHHPGLRTLVAAHLSAQNNRPELARQVLAEALGCDATDIQVADQHAGTAWITV